MAELPNREQLEKKLARELGGLLQAQMARLLELLGDPPDMNNVPQSFWDEAATELQSALQKHQLSGYLASAELMLDAQPIGVEWGIVNEHAAQWARQSAFNLIGGITDTSRRAVQEAVSGFFEQQMTMGDLRAQLTQIFGPTRARMIATTEVTRAAVEGERALVAMLETQGAPVAERRWLTNRDGKVCPICKLLDGLARGPAGYLHPDGRVFDRPPAHVSCRCSERHIF